MIIGNLDPRLRGGDVRGSGSKAPRRRAGASGVYPLRAADYCFSVRSNN
jgi:hypothetical protein